MPLEFQEGHCYRYVLRSQSFGVFFNEPLQGVVGAVKNHFYVVVPRLPRVIEYCIAFIFKKHRGLVPEPVQGLPQRGPPGLRPTGICPGGAPAVLPPPADPVDTAPGRMLQYLHLVLRRVFFKELSVVRDARLALLLNCIQRICQGHVPEAVVVAVGLAVSGDMHELRIVALLREPADQAVREVLAAL